jgi:hypothetical protein
MMKYIKAAGVKEETNRKTATSEVILRIKKWGGGQSMKDDINKRKIVTNFLGVGWYQPQKC